MIGSLLYLNMHLGLIPCLVFVYVLVSVTPKRSTFECCQKDI